MMAALESGNRIAIIAVLLALVALLLWPLVYGAPFLIHIAILVLLYSIGAASLHLILRMGHISLAHAAFLGLGGYASALLTTRLGVPFPVAFVASGLLPDAVALVFGPILLRLKGVYFVLMTFTFGEVVRLIFVEWQGLTGGSDGIYRIPPPHPALLSRFAFYYFALGMAVVCVGAVASMLMSPIGRTIDSIRESDQLAQSSGVPVLRFKVMIFAVACGVVGLQGSLLAHYIRYISPSAYTFNESLMFIIMNVIGGMNHLVGALVGAVFMTALPELLRGWVEYQRILYGVTLVLIMIYIPGGLIEIVRRLLPRLRGRREGAT
jgi:branched-chain amino acid transport system permease protein